MIRLKQVATVNGETSLVFEADGFPEGTRQILIPQAEIVERLKTVKNILGKPLTTQDACDAVIVLINQLRTQKTVLPERFDWTQYIGADLEK